MADINEQMITTLLDSNKALIASNEAISESVRANSETAKATNETVKELVVSVRELVTTERERVLKDKYQQEVNAKQEIYNVGNDARCDICAARCSANPSARSINNAVAHDEIADDCRS